MDFGDWVIVQYESVGRDGKGRPVGGTIKLLNRLSGNTFQIGNDGFEWNTEVIGRRLSDQNPMRVINQALRFLGDTVDTGMLAPSVRFSPMQRAAMEILAVARDLVSE
jgi:hypothetical protein